MHLKMSSAEVVCCKKLPNISDKLSIEANSVGSEQTAPINISADEKADEFVAMDALRVKY